MFLEKCAGFQGNSRETFAEKWRMQLFVLQRENKINTSDTFTKSTTFLNVKSAYKRGCTVTGNSHFLTFLRLLNKDAQTKWRPQTTDRRYSPLSHSVKVSSHDQGLQILLKPTNELKPMRRLCRSSAGFVPLSLRASPSHTPAESAKRQLHVFFAS